jgi:uncharacterized protein (DUF2267 family)
LGENVAEGRMRGQTWLNFAPALLIIWIGTALAEFISVVRTCALAARKSNETKEREMSATAVNLFGGTIEKTNVWINDLMAELASDEPERSYRALRAVLHALRDRLGVQEAADLGAQLPMLVRGFYYEGWSPGGKPVRDHTVDEFLDRVSDEFQRDMGPDPEAVVRAVFKVIAKHVSSGEIEDVKSNLPPDIRGLWTA